MRWLREGDVRIEFLTAAKGGEALEMDLSNVRHFRGTQTASVHACVRVCV